MQVDGEKDVGRLERVADKDDAGDDDDYRYTGNIRKRRRGSRSAVAKAKRYDNVKIKRVGHQ